MPLRVRRNISYVVFTKLLIGHGVTLCDRGRGSTERYVTPKIIYMNNIYYNFYCYVCLFIHIYMSYAVGPMTEP